MCLTAKTITIGLCHFRLTPFSEHNPLVLTNLNPLQDGGAKSPPHPVPPIHYPSISSSQVTSINVGNNPKTF